MNASDAIVVIAAVFAASVIQTVSGFGFALLCVPLLTLAVDIHTAVVISTMAGLTILLWQAWNLRHDADPVLTRRLTLSALTGMPLGLFVFKVVSESALMRLLGIAVLVAVVLLARGLDLRRSSGRLEAGAGFVSGVLATSLSTSGPPLVFALQARRLDPNRFRATISAVFGLSDLAATVFFVAAGEVTRRGIIGSLIALPAIPIGEAIGRPLRPRIGGEAFRRLVLVLLVAAAVRTITASF